MKKIFLLLLTCCLSLTMSAKVAYLLTGAVTDLDSYKAAIPDEERNGKKQHPEYNAAAWFKTEFVANGTGVFMTVAEFNDEEKRAGIDALWIYIDRVGIDSNNDIIADIDNDNKNKLGLNATFRDNLADFVNNGGNLYVAKQATRLVGDLGLAKKKDNGIIYPGFSNGGYNDADVAWKVFTGFNNAHHIAGKVNADHAFFSGAIKRDPNNDRNKTSFELLWPHSKGYTDNNCVIGNGDLEGDLAAFEDRNNCRVLGTWDNDQADCDCAGFIEFYPKGDRKGTVVMMGLAAYQWTSNNLDEDGNGGKNMKTITKNILNYLDKPVMKWSITPGDGILFEEKSAVLNDVANRTWTLSTDNTKAYTIENNRVRYMAIADALPVTATVNAGDGFSASKTVYSITRDVVVGRDNSPTAKLAYVLMNTNLNNLDSDEAGTYDPMYQSAEWFYNTYVKSGDGRFVTYDDIRDNGVPATVKTLWLHIDRKFNDAADFTTNYAKSELYDKLATYVKAGGNLYLSGFATYLVNSMSRYATAPDVCGWTSEYTANITWSIDRHVDGHAMFSEFAPTGAITLAHGTNCTDRNCAWGANTFDGSTYEKDLAGWHNGDATTCAGMVEFYPKNEWKGTIVANGVAAYQWGTCNNDGDNTFAMTNVKKLTTGILTYLGKTLSFNWITEPADGVISNTATVKIDHVAGNAVEFQVLNAANNEASFGEVTKENDGDYATLTYNKAGEGILIKVLGKGDGLNIPKNQEYSKEKTIKIVTPTVTWTVEPGDAAIAETKAPAQATCDATSLIVKYRSANPDQITIDESTGALTFKDETPKEGIDITAYVTVNEQEFSVTRKTRCDAPRVEWVTEPAATGVVGLDMEYKAKVTYGDATIGYDYTNCSDVDGKLHFTKVGDATVRPYAYVNNKKYYTEEVPAVTIAVSPDLKWEKGNPMSACVGEQGKTALATTNEGTIVYSSSDPEKVSVDAGGNLTFHAYAEACKVTIYATVTIDEHPYQISGEIDANLPYVYWVDGRKPAAEAVECNQPAAEAKLQYGPGVVQYEVENCTWAADKVTFTISEGEAKIKPYVEYEETRYYGEAVTITVSPVTFSWTHEPDHAHVGEGKPAAQAKCDNVEGVTVKYESSDPAIAEIDETSGQITYLYEGTCDITAFAEINGKTYSSAAFALTVNPYYYEREVRNTFTTICLPFEAEVVESVEKVFSLVGLFGGGGDPITGIILEEVQGNLVAGTPYILRTEATSSNPLTIKLNQIGRPVAEVVEANGLMGTFDPIDVTNGTCALPYYLSAKDDLLHAIGANAVVHVGANKAYFDLSKTQDLTSGQYAPGRLVMGVMGGNPISTDVENAIHADQAVKFIRNGKVYIRRGNQVYDILGK